MPNAVQAKLPPPREDRAGKKQRTRTRIVAQASRMLREQGLEKPAIDDVMAAADLTRGGFYAHFQNRDALVAEALNKAFDEARRHFFFIGDWADSPKGNLVGKKWVEYAARQYLSEGHLREAVTRCPLPSLGSEMARTRPEIRHVFTE
ncbi:MAG: TetR/AcrR family transcriptional regulator, partial [Polyangiaceae bacterium]